MKAFINWLLSRKQIKKTSIAGSVSLLILRVSVGLTMAFGHGWGKLMTFSERAAGFADPLGVGSQISLALTVFAEVFCSFALILGLLTRGFVIPLVILMFVAAFVIHGDDPFGRKELALMYLVPYLVILIAGPGRYSIDRLLGRK